MTATDAADVLVVGAGPAGAVLTRRLAEAGVPVLCLEQGEHPDRGELDGARSDWEVAARGPLSESPNVRAGPADYPVVEDASEVSVLTWNGVGGGSVIWGAQWERFLPSDFRVRSLDGVADDWPLAYGDLAPYYDRLDRAFGVSALPGDPAFPPGGDPAHPPLPIMPVGERVARAHNALGWHWWPGPNAIGPGCRLRGVCAYGCPHGAKASVDETHWPAAVAAGARLRTGARVRRVLLDGRGRAAGAEWVDRAGGEHVARARIVVLAANAIGTARLLLHSATPAHPDGLANGSGLVGRRLMLHPYTRVVGLFDEPLDAHQGHWGQLLHCLEFAETDPRRGFPRGTKWNLGPSAGPLTAALHDWGGERRWGAALAEHVRAWVGRAAIWGITADDLPDPDNRVTLHPRTTDSDSIPAPALTYRVSEDAQRSLDFGSARARESLEAAGVRRTLAPRRLRAFGWHQLGTARMGTDPGTSVVDPDGRAHEVPNLLVADASVFVTGSSVNPTATTCALALRAAERLLADRRTLAVAA